MLPDVPTTAELGLPDVRMDTWFGLIAPPDTAGADRRAPRARDRRRWCSEPAFQDKLSKMGCAVAWKPPAEFAAYIADETQEMVADHSRHGHLGRRIRTVAEWPCRRRHGASNGEDADLAERQEDRGFGDGDVRDLVGRQRAELFGADHAPQARDRRSCQQGLVDLWRPRRRMADPQHARPPADPRRRSSPMRAAPRNIPTRCKQIIKSGHDLAGHAYTQDQLLAYMPLDQQEATIRKSIDLLEACGGKKVTGWGSPVVAFTPETAGFLAKAGLKWTTDVTYADLPIKIHTPHGVIAGVPTTDFSDNRVMRASPRDLYDVYKGTFDYLRRERADGAPGAGHPLPVRRPAADHGGDAGGSEIYRQVARRLVRPPRGAGALGARRRRRRAHLSQPVLREAGATPGRAHRCADRPG